LYLVNKGILKQPILYLSDFFEKNKTLYYDNLMRVRTHNDIAQWFKFFLTGIIETAENGVKTFDGIMQLQKTIEDKLASIGIRSADARKVIEYLYGNPIIDAQKVAMIIEKTPNSAYSLLKILIKLELITEITGAQRGRLYVFEDYLELFDTRAVK